MVYTASAFYALEPLSLETRQAWRAELLSWQEPHLSGLVILAPDGVNATVAADPPVLDRLEDWFRAHLRRAPRFKHSFSDIRPFRRWKILLRKETVTTSGRLDAPAEAGQGTHLSAQEWHSALQEEGVVVIDVRNDYEYGMGHFRGAVDPQTHRFSDFADFIERAALPADTKILTYCTGGIRCEKAVPYMRSRGYQQVYQLDGGIIKYLEEFPGKQGLFQGECFVFDDRVALDDQLQPTVTYCKCGKCGQPAERRLGRCPACVS